MNSDIKWILTIDLMEIPFECIYCYSYAVTQKLRITSSYAFVSHLYIIRSLIEN